MAGSGSESVVPVALPSTSLFSDCSTPELAQPLFLQHIDQAVRLDSFLEHVQKQFEPLSSSDDSADNQSDTETAPGFQKVNGILSSRQERRSDRMKLYNFNKLKKSRKWIKNILLTDSSDSDEDASGVDIQRMLRIHKLKTNTAKQVALKPELRQYQYISTGILSNQDKFHEQQKAILGHKKKTKDKKSDKKKSKSKKRKMEKEEDFILSEQESALIREANKIEESINLTAAGGSESTGELGNVTSTPTHQNQTASTSSGTHTKTKKKAQNPQALEASMNAKRKRLWNAMCKKEISRTQKQIFAAHKEDLTNAKKLAVSCQRECRKGALLSQKVVKDTPSMSRRLTKEMLLYWKRYEKVEKEHRKRAEKEAQEQLRMDIELREAKRQQRKLNFLITQTELYAHFMSRKMRTDLSMDETEQKILNQLDETKPKLQIKEELNSDSVVISALEDDYDPDYVKAQALFNAQQAYKTHQDKVNVFGESKKTLLPEVSENFNENFRLMDPTMVDEMEHDQPSLFEGKLKTYQLKGMNWLNNLYDKGINGILADEMGLGKTVQTIAFLALLAEGQGIWGPFLVIAPASTLHNWQQELSRFIPKFKVLPYWGNTSDRKVLRKFWNSKDELHSEGSPYHVLVTSYQLVVQDIKYFQRIKWQYMVLDEAQAIKSTSSVRWKLLLGFRCRNRLLLTGTPIQNSMAELWALLHFIMPTLFDSHDEFNEWFSKDIESHAENKSAIDEKHLSRLHMILKPFMLRRIKKDVENELSDKIEILVSCHLTKRQLALYYNLRSKISIDDLLQSSYGSNNNSSLQSATSSLMNLVMQFRKVCNHPDLFERREAKSPFHLRLGTYLMPRTLFNQCSTLNGFREHIPSFLNIFHPDHIYQSLFTQNSECFGSAFSFSRFCDLSPGDVCSIVTQGNIARWLANYILSLVCKKLYHQSVWQDSKLAPLSKRFMFLINETQPSHQLSSSSGPLNGQLVSIKPCGLPLYSLITESTTNESSVVEMTEVCSMADYECEPTLVPKVLFCPIERVSSNPIDFYTPDPAVCRRLFCFSNLRPFGTRPSNIDLNQELSVLLKGPEEWLYPTRNNFVSSTQGGILACHPPQGFTQIAMPYKDALIMDSGKLRVLDVLLTRLKNEGHRVLIYSQMTRMIDILEDYMCYRKHTYMRLDGSSKISDRRDMVADFQSRSDIFVFLLSTRAGGLGINLTAADTVIFYDSDWNPTVDQQAMDRAHRLGQTKQVTVYRLICKDSIEERILQRAKEKSEIQRMVISGGHFRPDTLKPKEVVSLLLDDKELEKKFNQRQEERKFSDDPASREVKKRKKEKSLEKKIVAKKKKLSVTDEENIVTNHSIPDYQQSLEVDSIQSNDSFPPPSPYSEHSMGSSSILAQDDSSSESPLVVDDVNPKMSPIPVPFFSLTGAGWSTLDGPLGGAVSPLSGGSSFSLQAAVKRAGARSRGRPRGSARRGLVTTAPRGVKTSTLATAAAELAGAQAGKSAVFAAYGYTLPSSTNAAPTPSVASPSSTSSSPAASSLALSSHSKN